MSTSNNIATSTFTLAIAQQMSVHIKSLRRARGLTQQDLAALIGVGQARMAAIEKNPGAVSLDQLLQIIHALGAKLQLFDSTLAKSAMPYAQQDPAPPLQVREASRILW